MTTTENTTPASKNKITRRQMLKSVSTAAAAVAVASPALGADADLEGWATDPDAAATEQPHDKVHRLARELSLALREWDGFKRAIVTPDHVMYDALPDLPESGDSGRSDDLSFVVRKPKGQGGGFDYWNVESTGDYGHDCYLGRRLGEEYLAYIGKRPTNGNATLLHCIVDSMMSRRSEPSTHWGRHATGIEIGFLAAVNGYAMATAKFVHQSTTAA